MTMPTDSHELRHVIASAVGVDMPRRALVVVTDIFKNEIRYEVIDGETVHHPRY